MGGPCGLTKNISNTTELLRWWHQHQAQQWNHEADLIRNGLLQEIFALRRRLELACQTQPNADEFGCAAHLAELSKLYTSLESLGNRLGSPYLQESLPLALQFTILPWQAKCDWQVDLPPIWEVEPVENIRLLIMLTETCLQAFTAEAVLPEQCRLCLTAQAHVKELTFHLAYPQALPLPLVEAISARLAPLLETFKLFTQGDYGQTVQPQALSWVLRWPTQTPVCPAS